VADIQAIFGPYHKNSFFSTNLYNDRFCIWTTNL